MTDSNLTFIGVVVDRSGSMLHLASDMEGSLSNTLREQSELPGECLVSLYQFDDVHEHVYGPVTIEAAPKYKLVARGTTALLDATGKSIVSVGEHLNSLPEDQRPGKVLMVIITDGHENSSREWTWDSVKKKITEQQEKYQWEFVFLGANIDAETVGTSMGIDRGSTLTYDASSAGLQVATASLGNYLGNTRSGLRATFSDEDRQNAVKK
jgi:uncharacterized protein YegL